MQTSGSGPPPIIGADLLRSEALWQFRDYTATQKRDNRSQNAPNSVKAYPPLDRCRMPIVEFLTSCNR
jgi:hypothetical protein